MFLRFLTWCLDVFRLGYSSFHSYLPFFLFPFILFLLIWLYVLKEQLVENLPQLRNAIKNFVCVRAHVCTSLPFLIIKDTSLIFYPDMTLLCPLPPKVAMPLLPRFSWVCQIYCLTTTENLVPSECHS